MLGRMTIRTFPKAVLDEWESQIREKVPPESQANAMAAIERDRRRLQGRAVACITVTAEEEFAKETAGYEAERTVALLRAFSPANLVITRFQYCAPRDLRPEEGVEWIVAESGIVRSHSRASPEPRREEWLLTDVERAELDKTGLSEAGTWLVGENLSDYKKLLLRVLLLYSRQQLTNNLSEKLVYQFAALESLLTRGNEGNIQQSVAERMALLTDTTAEERIALVEETKALYDLRSRFVHAGQEEVAQDRVERFCQRVWILLMSLAPRAHVLSSQSDLLSAIELAKYTVE